MRQYQTVVQNGMRKKRQREGERAEERERARARERKIGRARARKRERKRARERERDLSALGRLEEARRLEVCHHPREEGVVERLPSLLLWGVRMKEGGDVRESVRECVREREIVRGSVCWREAEWLPSLLVWSGRMTECVRESVRECEGESACERERVLERGRMTPLAPVQGQQT